jgi:hypothetical protein
MRFLGILLLSLPLVAAASPLGSGGDSRSRKIDPFHGDWKCLRCTAWNEKGEPSDRSGRGIVVRFERDRMLVLDETNGPKEQHIFRVLNRKGDAEGMIAILDKGQPKVRLRYRFAEGQFLLCMKPADHSVGPEYCGPGKQHILFEFLPYQSTRVVPSHTFPPAPAKSR